MTAITSFPASSRRAPRHIRRAALPLALAAALTVGSAPAALAQVASTQLPTGGSIVGGTGTINAANGASRVVDQTSSRMALTWSAFDIGSAATMTFNQPSSNAVVLNLVQGGNPTQIYGNLNANGQVFLLNSNGLLIGSDAKINVGGLVLSTLGTSASSFMNGNYVLDAGGNTVALISNSGTINAAAGGVALIGGRVANIGSITAQAGNISLTGADAATLTFESGGFGVLIDKPLQLSLGSEAISNSGTLSTPGGEIRLQARAAQGIFDRLINNSGTIRAASLTGGPGGSVSLVASGGGSFDIVGGGSIDAGTGAITISAGRSVQQTGVLTGGSVGGFIGGNAALTGANQISSISGEVLGNLDLRNSRGLGQTGGLTVGGASTFTVLGNALVLSHAANDFSGPVNISAGAATVFDRSALTLGSVSVDSLNVIATGPLNLGFGSIRGALDAKSNGGTVLQSSASGLTVDGASSIDAGSGSIALTNGFNEFKSTLSLRGATVKVASGYGLRLGTLSTDSLDVQSQGALSLGNGVVNGSLYAASGNGPVSQASTGGLIVSGTTGINAGTGAITLTTEGNDFQQSVSLTGGATQISDSTALLLGDLSTGSLAASSRGALTLGTGTIGGTLTALSNNGTITQSGVINVAGTSTINAGTGAIALGDDGNDFGGAMSLTGGSVVVHDRNNLTVSALANAPNGAVDLFSNATLVLGNFAIDTGTASLRLASNGGALSTAGAIRGGTVTLRARDGVGIAHDITASQLLLQTGNAAVNQTAGAINVAGLMSASTGTGALNLTGAGNNFRGNVDLATGNAQISDIDQLTFGTLATGDLTASSGGALSLGRGRVGGNLTAVSGLGGITQNSALTITGTSLLNSGSGAATLTNAGNDFQGAVAFSGTGLSLRDANDLTISSLNTVGTGFLDLVALGTLTLPAQTINVGGGALSLASLGGALDIAGTLSGGDVSLQSRDALTLDHSVNASGSLSVKTENSAINQTAGTLAVAGASRFDAGTASISLGRVDNDFGGAVSLTGSGSLVRDRNALTLGTLSTGALTAISNGALNLGSGSVDSLVAISNGHAITQSGALTVRQASAFIAGNGSITLENAGNDFQSGVTLSGAGVSLRDANDLTIASLTSSNSSNVVVEAGGGLTLPATSINAGSGDITLFANGGALNTAAAIAGGNVALRARDGLSLGHDVTATGSLTLSTSNQAITQTAGALTVGGFTAVDAGTGFVALDQSVNDFQGAVGLNAGSALITDANGLTLGESDIVGALRARSGGDFRLGGQVRASDIDLAAGGAFRNEVGPNALSASGRWRVFLASPLDGHVYNGLDSGGTAVWNTPALGSVSGSGNRYVFAYQPTLRWTSVNRSKTYGDSASLTDAFSVSGLMPGAPGAYRADTLSAIATGAPSLTSLGVAPTATVAGGPYVIEIGRGTLDTNASGYALAFDSAGLLTVGRAGLTVQASDASKTYGEAATLRGYSVSGLRNSDAVSSVELVSGGTGRTASVGDYVITAGDAEGTGLSNYDITYADGVLRVGRAGLTIRASDASKTYGDQATLSGFTVDGLLNGDRVEAVDLVSAGTAATARVGSYVIEAENADGLGLSNYEISYADGQLTVSKAGLVITAGNASKTYGQTAALSAFSASGMRNQDSVSSVALSSDGAAAGANSGVYRITAENARGTGLDNYDVSYVEGTLSVGKAGLTVRANDASKIYGDTSALAGFTAEGLVNGDSVSSATLSSDGAGATAIVGSYRIDVSGASGQGLSNYDITYADGTLSVGKAGLTITAANAGKVYGETADLTSYAVWGLRNADAVSTVALESDGSAPTANVGGYLIRAGGAEGSGLSNYDITYVDGLLSVSKAGLTITAQGASKTYGHALAPTMFQAEGLRNADAVSSVALSSAGSAETAVVGDYLIRASGAGGAGLSNYDITYVDGVLSVGKASLTITALGARKTYGDAAELRGYRAEGLVNADRVSNVALSSEGSAETAAVGSYLIRASDAEGAGLSNYSITYVDGVLTVGKAGLTITASDETKRYGTAARLDGYAVSGLRNGDQVSSVALSSAGAPANALRGRYRIEAGAASGSGLSNYDVRYVDGTLSVIDAASRPDASAIANATRAAHTQLDRNLESEDITGASVSIRDGGVALPDVCATLEPTGSCSQALQQR